MYSRSKGKVATVLPGASCVPLIAGKASANAGRKSVPDWGKKQFKRKRHRAFLQLKRVVLAKSDKVEVDFAHNPGTVPRPPQESLQFEVDLQQNRTNDDPLWWL